MYQRSRRRARGDRFLVRAVRRRRRLDRGLSVGRASRRGGARNHRARRRILRRTHRASARIARPHQDRPCRLRGVVRATDGAVGRFSSDRRVLHHRERDPGRGGRARRPSHPPARRSRRASHRQHRQPAAPPHVDRSRVRARSSARLLVRGAALALAQCDRGLVHLPRPAATAPRRPRNGAPPEGTDSRSAAARGASGRRSRSRSRRSCRRPSRSRRTRGRGRGRPRRDRSRRLSR